MPEKKEIKLEANYQFMVKCIIAMILLILLQVEFVIKLSAQSAEISNLKTGFGVDSNNIPLSQSQFYFPVELYRNYKCVKTTIEKPVGWRGKRTAKFLHFYYDTLAGKTVIDSFALVYQSEKLFELEEPIIFNEKYRKECYRFTWLRSFHNPVVIRIEKVDTFVYIVLKVANGAGGYQTGKVIKNDTIYLSLKDWISFNNNINNINYWEMPSLSKEIIFGCDGADWILEGRLKNKYQVVQRWSPTKDREINFRNVCEKLIKMSKLNLRKKEIY